MKVAKKQPLIRVQDTILHLSNLCSIWYDEDASGSGDYYLSYSCTSADGTGHIGFGTKKAALQALDEIMLAINIPIIEEYEDD